MGRVCRQRPIDDQLVVLSISAGKKRQMKSIAISVY
jgi:hypothetical protein